MTLQRTAAKCNLRRRARTLIRTLVVAFVDNDNAVVPSARPGEVRRDRQVLVEQRVEPLRALQRDRADCRDGDEWAAISARRVTGATNERGRRTSESPADSRSEAYGPLADGERLLYPEPSLRVGSRVAGNDRGVPPKSDQKLRN